MRFSIKSKILCSFSIIVSYCLLFVWLNERTYQGLYDSTSRIVMAINPAIQNIEGMRANALRLIDASTSLHFYRLLGREGEASVRNQFHEADQARSALSQAIDLYKTNEHLLEAEGAASDEILDTAERIIYFAGILMASEKAADPAELIRTKDQLEALESRFIEMTDTAIQFSLIDLRSRVDQSLIASNQIRKSARISGFILFALAIFNAYLLSRILLKPFSALKKAAGEVSKGNFAERIDHRGNDEIADLSEAFNLMSARLSENVVSREFLESVLDSLPEFLIVTDKKLKILRANKAFAAFAGVPQGDLTEMHLAGFISSDRPFEKKVETAVSLGGEFAAHFGSGKNSVPLKVVVAPRHGSNEGDYIFLIRDISQQLRAESEILDYRKRISQAEKLATLCTLGGIVAHKLNQPLTAIKLFLQQAIGALKPVDIPASAQENLNDCLQSLKNASDFVQQVLSYSKRASGDPEVSISLEQVAVNAKRALAQESARAGLSIELSGLSGLPSICARAFEIEEVFHVLIQNAIQACQPGKQYRMMISAVQNEGALLLSFEDTCGGIQPEAQSRILDEFFTTKPKDQGSGFGLHIVRQILRNHGASLSIDVKEGEGTRFTVTFPQVMVQSKSDDTPGRDRIFALEELKHV